jgi:hypothetical protein
MSGAVLPQTNVEEKYVMVFLGMDTVRYNQLRDPWAKWHRSNPCDFRVSVYGARGEKGSRGMVASPLKGVTLNPTNPYKMFQAGPGAFRTVRGKEPISNKPLGTTREVIDKEIRDVFTPELWNPPGTTLQQIPSGPMEFLTDLPHQ